MSTYCRFYIGEENENKKISIIGPRYGEAGEFFPLYERSESFTHLDEFREIMVSLGEEHIAEDSRNILGIQMNEKYYPSALALPIDFFLQLC